MSVVSMKSLLEAGVHFGHQTRRWNPKMRPYIFTERNGIYILDLQRTLREIEAAHLFVRDLAARGGQVLFVGTKKQAQEPIQSQAERAGQPFVNQRWLGGMLTNFATMRTRVARLVELETMEVDGRMASLPKKEQLLLRKEWDKLNRNLSGVREMKELPGALFVVDTKREAIAVAEARRLRIPIIGLVDTNADPDEVDFVIPGNDDAIRSVGLMCRVIADGVIDGRAALEGPHVAEAEERTQPVVVPTPEAPDAELADEAPAEEAPAEDADTSVETPAAEASAEADAEPEAVEAAPAKAPAKKRAAASKTKTAAEEPAEEPAAQ